jgi:hypothetical protein
MRGDAARAVSHAMTHPTPVRSCNATSSYVGTACRSVVMSEKSSFSREPRISHVPAKPATVRVPLKKILAVEGNAVWYAGSYGQAVTDFGESDCLSGPTSFQTRAFDRSGKPDTFNAAKATPMSGPYANHRRLCRTDRLNVGHGRHSARRLL